MTLDKGVGDRGIFQPAGHEAVGVFHGRIGGRGQADVKGDVDVGGQRDSVEGGDEEAGHLGERLVGAAVLVECWCGVDGIGFRRGGGWFLFVKVLTGNGTGGDDGEGVGRGTHQVLDVSGD